MMSAFSRSAVGVLALALAAAATAAPAPTSGRLAPITPATAARLRPIGEVPQEVFRIVWGPGRGRFTLVGWQTPAEVFDLDTLRPVRTLGADRKLIQFAAAGGDTVAWCENDTRVEVRDLKAGRTVMIDAGNEQPRMAFSPDGKLLATGGYGTEAKLWDPATGQLVRALGAGPEGGLTVVFSPDGKLAAVGNRNAETRVFEAATGKLLHTLPKPMSHELRFSPSGKVLAVGYVDGSVGLWDVATGESRGRARAGVREVYTLDWSPAGDLLATAGLGGVITLWDRELKPVKELAAPEHVSQVRFSPDGSRLLSAGRPHQPTPEPSPDQKLVVWGLPGGGK